MGFAQGALCELRQGEQARRRASHASNITSLCMVGRPGDLAVQHGVRPAPASAAALRRAPPSFLGLSARLRTAPSSAGVSAYGLEGSGRATLPPAPRRPLGWPGGMETAPTSGPTTIPARPRNYPAYAPFIPHTNPLTF